MKKISLVLSSLTLASLLTFAGCDNNENSSSALQNSTNTPISTTTSTSTTVSSSIITSSNAPVKEKHTVTFVLNNGEENKERSVSHNGFIVEPASFEKEYYVIEGWYTDPECVREKWNFEVDRVTEDITLYAKWEVNYQDWIWRLSRLASKQTIMLYVEHFGSASSTSASTAGFGSGVVIAKETDDSGQEYFYALSNNHVVSAENDKGETVVYPKRRITIYDHYQNQYYAELLATENTYDLSLVKFKTTPDIYGVGGSMADPEYENGQYAVRVATFAESDPEAGVDVASYGSPIAQMGVCTIGNITYYGDGCISENDKGISFIHEFEVIHHNASILSGNSGGPLFDAALNLVGINYGSSGSNDTYLSSGDFFAVPISRVRDFLDIYVVDVYDGLYDFLGEL